MKLRATTTASLSRFKTISIATLLVAVVAISSFTMIRTSLPVSADAYDDKIRALQADMARYQAEADRLNGEAASLQNALSQLANERAALQSQVDLSQAEYDKLVVQIAETEEKIKNNQDALGDILADLYVDGQTTPLELVASSTSITDFINKQEYRNSVRDELGSTIKTVKELKSQLQQQKTDVEKVLQEQKAARDALVAKETEQQNLLNQTQNNEATYNNLIRDSEAQIAEARATQAALRARSNATGGYVLIDSGSLTAYPWNESNCPMWGYLSTGGANGSGGDGRGYGCRQCASYVAWRIARETGIYYTNWGNGGDFGSAATNAGYQNLGMSPQAGSIAVLYGNPGHVAWVEGVSPDGQHVTISQYNYNYGAGTGMYSQMVVSTNFFDQYVKIL